MGERRPKGWWKWYYQALDTLAQRAYDTAMVVSDGDMRLAGEARRGVRARHYWHEAGQNSKGQDVFFCWTLHPDEHGEYHTWREVHTSTAIKRYDYAHRKTKAAVAEIARKRYNAFIEATDEADTEVAEDDELLDWSFKR